MTTTRSLDDICAEYEDLAHHVAHQVQRCRDDHDDLFQEGMLALCEFHRRQEGRPNRIDCEPKFVKTMMRRRMQRYTYQRFPKTFNRFPESFRIEVVGIEDYAKTVYVREYLNEIEHLFGSEARAVAEELIEPSEDVVALALAETNVRATGIVSMLDGSVAEDPQEEPVLLVSAVDGSITSTWKRREDLSITHEHIRTVLGLTQARWMDLLDKIRHFTVSWIKAPIPTPC